MATPVAVVACILSLPTILCNVTLVPTSEAEVVLATSPASATSPAGAGTGATTTYSSASTSTSTPEGAVLDPMSSTVTTETLVDVLVHYLCQNKTCVTIQNPLEKHKSL